MLCWLCGKETKKEEREGGREAKEAQEGWRRRLRCCAQSK
jgi:hypothetical protein